MAKAAGALGAPAPAPSLEERVWDALTLEEKRAEQERWEAAWDARVGPHRAVKLREDRGRPPVAPLPCRHDF